jgi:hypothetical protein
MALSSDDSAANWPEAPTYAYSGAEAHLPLLMGGAMVGGSLFGLAAMGFAALYEDIPSITFVILAALVFFSVLLSVWLVPYMARARPAIALSADGVFAYLKGKPWRFIGWHDVAAITRRTWFDKGGHPHLWLLIEGARHTIQVRETIDGYADLRVRLTRYARDHRVPLHATVQGQASEVAEL